MCDLETLQSEMTVSQHDGWHYLSKSGAEGDRTHYAAAGAKAWQPTQNQQVVLCLENPQNNR